MASGPALTSKILREHAHTFSPWLRFMHAAKRIRLPRMKRRYRPPTPNPVPPRQSRRGETRQRLIPRNAPASSGDTCTSPVYPV